MIINLYANINKAYLISSDGITLLKERQWVRKFFNFKIKASNTEGNQKNITCMFRSPTREEKEKDFVLYINAN